MKKLLYLILFFPVICHSNSEDYCDEDVRATIKEKASTDIKYVCSKSEIYVYDKSCKQIIFKEGGELSFPVSLEKCEQDKNVWIYRKVVTSNSKVVISEDDCRVEKNVLPSQFTEVLEELKKDPRFLTNKRLGEDALFRLFYEENKNAKIVNNKIEDSFISSFATEEFPFLEDTNKKLKHLNVKLKNGNKIMAIAKLIKKNGSNKLKRLFSERIINYVCEFFKENKIPDENLEETTVYISNLSFLSGSFKKLRPAVSMKDCKTKKSLLQEETQGGKISRVVAKREKKKEADLLKLADGFKLAVVDEVRIVVDEIDDTEEMKGKVVFTTEGEFLPYNTTGFFEELEEFDELSEFSHIFGPVLEDLNKLHKVGKYHRDVKPDNILVSESGRPKLIDFDFMTDVKSHGDEVKGSPIYMSPMYLMTYDDVEDDRSKGNLLKSNDLWGFGISALEALAKIFKIDKISSDNINFDLSNGIRNKYIFLPGKDISLDGVDFPEDQMEMYYHYATEGLEENGNLEANLRKNLRSRIDLFISSLMKAIGDKIPAETNKKLESVLKSLFITDYDKSKSNDPTNTVLGLLNSFKKEERATVKREYSALEIESMLQHAKNPPKKERYKKKSKKKSSVKKLDSTLQKINDLLKNGSMGSVNGSVGTESSMTVSPGPVINKKKGIKARMKTWVKKRGKNFLRLFKKKKN